MKILRSLLILGIFVLAQETQANGEKDCKRMNICPIPLRVTGDGNATPCEVHLPDISVQLRASEMPVLLRFHFSGSDDLSFVRKGVVVDGDDGSDPEFESPNSAGGHEHIIKDRNRRDANFKYQVQIQNVKTGADCTAVDPVIHNTN